MSASSEVLACYSAEFVQYLGRKDEQRGFKKVPFERSRVLKLAAYGLAVAGPLQHYALRLAGRLSPPGTPLRRLRLFLTTLILLPALNSAHVASMAVVSGARSKAQIKATVRRAAMPATYATAPVLPFLAVVSVGSPNEEAWQLAFAAIVTTFATVFRAAWLASR
ncbi:hypothetical protein BZA70DRAFT_46737 [Myxozyma melibiosi]|uniref:Integral membrane protein n=1 Tax=Myxozyma melibiosi TaxID=54550 RepID=A0ABR1FFU4_9ASCO